MLQPDNPPPDTGLHDLAEAIGDAHDVGLLRHRGWHFRNVVDLVFVHALGSTAHDLRAAYGLPAGASVVPILSAADVARVKRTGARVAALLELGWNYRAIAAELQRDRERPIAWKPLPDDPGDGLGPFPSWAMK